MLTYQVYEYYQFVLAQLAEFKTVISPMLEFADKYNSCSLIVIKEILGNSKLVHIDNGYHYIVNNGNLLTSFNDIMSQFKITFKPFQALSKYSLIKQNIDRYKKEYGIDDNEIDSFLKIADQNFNYYQDYLQSSDDRIKASSFGQYNIVFSESFKSIENFYSNAMIILSNNCIESELPENKETLDIQLLQTFFTFEQFVDNLSIINQVYQEIGSVIGQSSSGVGYEKLQIVKIESGSLLAKVLGDKNIIEVISLLLHKTIELAFQKFTIEGRIIRHNELMKAIKSNLEVNEQLSALGYDLSSSDAAIEKTYALATKGLLKIAASSAYIKINNDPLSAIGCGQQKYLDEAKAMFLSDSHDEITN